MNMPGFTAETSAYRTGNAYRAVYGTLAGSASAVAIPSSPNLSFVTVGPRPLGVVIGFICYVLCYTQCRAWGYDHGVCRDACRDICTRPSVCPTGQTPCGEKCCAPGEMCLNGACVADPCVPPPGGYCCGGYGCFDAANSRCCIDSRGLAYCCPNNLNCCPTGCHSFPCS